MNPSEQNHPKKQSVGVGVEFITVLAKGSN